MSNSYEDLDDDELRAELISHGISVGPVTPSTRKVYIKKLMNRRTSPVKPAAPKSSRRSLGSSSSPSTQRNPSPKATNRRSSPVTQSSPKSHRRSSPTIYRPVERVAPEIPLQRPSAVSPTLSTTYRPPNRYERIPSDISPPRPSAVPQSSPRTYRRSSPSLYKPPERITPDVLRKPTFSPQKVDFNTSAHDNDDDHMEFSQYIPRKNRSFKESAKPGVTVTSNPAFLGGLAFTAAVIAFMFFPDTVHGGISKGSDYINHAIMLGFKYAIIPFFILGLVAALCFGGYYVFQIRKKRIAIYEEKKQKLIKNILKAVYNAPPSGIPVKQLRDKMIPAYKRTKEELLLWNECEAFVKTYDTRVRAEERTLNRDDEIVEHFVWIGSTLNDDFGD